MSHSKPGQILNNACKNANDERNDALQKIVELEYLAEESKFLAPDVVSNKEVKNYRKQADELRKEYKIHDYWLKIIP